MPEEWVEELRARGYRLTPQRQLVLDTVAELQHTTPEQLHQHLQAQRRSVNLATVYRTLDLLSDLGLVGHSQIGQGAPTYHLIDHADHLHLVCRECKAVSQAPLALAGGLRDQLLSEYGFDADLGHLTVLGYCARCRAAAGS